jgi:hypothetical protein
MGDIINRIIELEDEIQNYSYQLLKGAPTGTSQKKDKAIKELRKLCKIRKEKRTYIVN